MDLNQKIIAALLAGFFIIALLRVFSAPLKLALKLLVNTLLVIGILGLPGFILLLLTQWII